MTATNLASAVADGSATPMLVATGVSKRFGASQALREAGLALLPGEVHGLLGANGAGKSTLSRIVAGHLRADDGTLTMKGRPLSSRGPRAALDAGIVLVTQETTLAPDLSVLENIFLPMLGGKAGLSFPAMRRRGAEILATLGQGGALPLDAEAGTLSIAQRQLVEIAKALAVEADVIIFDEPTASLSPGEVDRLFLLIDRLRRDGRAIVFVSHRLEEVFAITDRVTVLREGGTVAASVPTASLDQSGLIRLMVGQELGRIYSEAPPAISGDREVLLKVRNLRSAPAVRNVSFDLRRGEILGLAGLVGAGRSETVEAMMGLRRRDGGEIVLHGKPFHARKPSDGVRAGMVLVPEDRRRQSILPHFSVAENLLLGHLAASRGFFTGYRRRRKRIDELMALLEIPPDRLADDSLLNFSGGMQQKIIIARWLMLDPSILILDEPTRGVDIATRASIYGLLRRIADGGVGVLVVSSDFEELLGVCERLVVISDGVSTAQLESTSVNEEMLTLLAAPRSSMGRVQAVLDELVARHGGASFWGLAKGGSVVSLASGAGSGGGPADPAFSPGRTVDLPGLDIEAMLAARRTDFVPSAGGSVLFSRMETARGHDNGFLALRLPPGTDVPKASLVHDRVGMLAETGQITGDRT